MAPQGLTLEHHQQGNYTPSSPTPPISRLPPEILPIIFFEAVQASRSKTSTALTISCVSQHWRNVALSAPELWALIDTLDVEIIQTFMVRAKDRPLSVVLTSVKSENPLPIITVLKSLHNIRHLQLSVYYKEDWSRVRSLPEMTGPAPVLETLRLNGICLPNIILSGSVPSLRHLDLNTFDAEWKTIPNCPQLQSLCITRPETQIRVSEFLQRLHTFPLLEKLQLECCFADRSGVSIPNLLGPIELPNLKELTFDTEDTSNVIPLLEHLRIPSTCQVSLDLMQDEPDEHLSLFPAFSACRTGSPRNIRELQIVADHSLWLKIYEGDRPPAGPEEDHDAEENRYTTNRGPNLEVTIWSPYSNEDAGRSIGMATDICQNYVNLNDLEVIDLIADGLINYPTQSFWKFVGSLSTLRVLKVRYRYAQSFIEFLSAAPQSPDRKFPPFSTIQKLVYEDLSDVDEVEEYSTRLIGLTEYLQIRAEMGVPLTILTLIQVGEDVSLIPGGLLEDLQGSVQQVKRRVRKRTYDEAELVE
ncbi:hypothetical protein BDN72DRAFT_849772 [Pluteus cervinus]|uniref:Uncharacterized protein n=1 Tax=Pluteus cervinus TaxID=181527 RepID=A0ACD3A674_9AGAR|nr:hypothetical protein BDN72DRAFT_849772 [Pluteus cervinus]